MTKIAQKTYLNIKLGAPNPLADEILAVLIKRRLLWSNSISILSLSNN